jgi:molybdenum cofactor biosynthesis enzyme MoaA
MSDREIDLRQALRGDGGKQEIKTLLAQAIHNKPAHHHLNEALSPRDRTMAQIGG